MSQSPFYPFRNTTLVFEVEDSTSDDVDKSGNPTPSTKRVTIEAFLKPVKSARKDNYTDYPNLGTSEEYLKGFVVSPESGFPDGVVLLSKTVSAKYRDQDGVFTRTLNLQSSVGADKITGYPIAGIFKIL